MQSNRFGTVGRPVRAYVNAFDLQWSSSAAVFHYDAIRPLWTSRNPQTEIKIGPAKGIELLQRLQTNVAPQLFPKPGVFDGKKNLFSFMKFNFTSQNFTVPWDHEQIDRRDHRAKMVSVDIVYVKGINMMSLQNILNGKATPQNLGSGTDFAASLNMLNLYVQAQPKLIPGNLYKGKNVYIQWSQRHVQTQEQRAIDSRMSPLKLLEGFFQSVRPTIGRLILNVDVATGVMLPDQQLIEVCARFLNVRNARNLNGLSEDELQHLRQFLKGVKVTVTMPGLPPRSRARAIRDVIHDVGRRQFDKEGVQVTVQEHFRHVYRLDIPPRTLGVLIGRHELFPITVCRVPTQLYKPKLQPDHIRNVLSFVPQNPAQRLEKITAGWHNLGHSSSEFLRGAQINISAQPLTVDARILPTPDIEYGAPRGMPPERIPTRQKPGTWDVMNKILRNPGRIRVFTVVNFTGNQVTQAMGDFVDDLLREMRNREIRNEIDNYNAVHIQNGHPQGRIEQTLQQLMAQAGARSPDGSFALCILPENAADLYQNIKRAGDIILGVLTQCVRWSRKLAGDAERRRCNQYNNNLILKINGKIGGVNHVPVSDGMNLLRSEVTMVIGADVSHPAPGSLGPSIASVVASWDRKFMQYAAQINVQHSRLEIIEKLRDMVANCVELFKKNNQQDLLTRIILLRDGVSEGEFETIRQQELEPLKKALEVVYQTWGVKLVQRPKLTFVVVGKRHHFRFFPSSQDADRSGNCQAGFVVDQNIVHPVYRDFYLQSQPGLKGTSIPGHYTIIEDESFGGNADALQQIAFALCHCYARSTRSVKIPAPVYYADLVCRRAKFHFSEAVHYSDNMSSASGETQTHIDFYKQHFQAVSASLRSTMYFL